MAQEGINSVVIVGGGTAGWMAAAALSKFLGSRVAITLVESDQIGTVGVGEATIPQIKVLNQTVGIDERELIANTHGSFKLGIEFINWRQLGHRYLHNFGKIGLDLNRIHFHHYWVRARQSGSDASLWDYCVNTQAAVENRFARLDRLGQTELSGLVYAYHLDASLYGQLLRRHAEHAGVTRVEGKVVHVRRHGQTGDIAAVTLDGGREMAGDFFVDCSGFRGLLIGGALETDYQDWSHWLRSDTAVAVGSTATGPFRPYTQSIAHRAGWQWRIPLQHRTGNGHVFSADHMSVDEATAILLDNLEGEPLSDPRVIRFTTGRRAAFWAHNCVALGLASGFLEPLESTSIHLIQSGISRLLPLFPGAGPNGANRDEYNRQMSLEFEKIRDFLVLHYHLNERTDSQYWVDMRQMGIPPSLVRKMALFAENGRLYHEQEDLFTLSSWLQVMVGQGLMPQGYHPIADQLDDDQLTGFLADVHRIVRQHAARLPTHGEFVRHVMANANANGEANAPNAPVGA